MHPEPNEVKAVIVDQQRNIVEDTQTIMSDGFASNAPDAASEEDAMTSSRRCTWFGKS